MLQEDSGEYVRSYGSLFAYAAGREQTTVCCMVKEEILARQAELGLLSLMLLLRFFVVDRVNCCNLLDLQLSVNCWSVEDMEIPAVSLSYSIVSTVYFSLHERHHSGISNDVQCKKLTVHIDL